MVDARGMRDRVTVLQITHDVTTDTYDWTALYQAWASVKLENRSNLFSSVGIGARGVSLTMWRNPRLTLHHAIRLKNGQFCFLTAVVPVGDGLHSTVQAALCTPVSCRSEDGPGFPGILTEKYLGHQQLEPHAVTTTTYVLVAPEEIHLAAGSLITIDGTDYEVQIAHLLDEYKHEFEITRLEDA